MQSSGSAFPALALALLRVVPTRIGKTDREPLICTEQHHSKSCTERLSPKCETALSERVFIQA